MKKFIVLAMAPACILGVATLRSDCMATTFHVPGDADTIQGGINLAVPGDSVLVACGTYHEHDLAMHSGVVLRSETGQPDCVTIDAQQQGRVILCRFNNAGTRIEGFTITGGFVPYESGIEGNGGGIYCLDNAAPWIVDCVIQGNFANFDGGGVACNNSSKPHIVDCTIEDNDSNNGGSGVRCNNNSSARLERCTIANNHRTGVWVGNSSAPVLTDCTISGNKESGVYVANGAITLRGGMLSGNMSAGSSAGGLWMWRGTAILEDCTLAHNVAGAGGGIRAHDDCTVTLTDCVLEGNTAGQGGAVFLEQQCTMLAENTEFRDNAATDGGTNGLILAGCEATLQCSVDDLTGFEGDGTIILDNEGCSMPVEVRSWSRVKASFR